MEVDNKPPLAVAMVMVVLALGVRFALSGVLAVAVGLRRSLQQMWVHKYEQKISWRGCKRHSRNSHSYGGVRHLDDLPGGKLRQARYLAT